MRTLRGCRLAQAALRTLAPGAVQPQPMSTLAAAAPTWVPIQIGRHKAALLPSGAITHFINTLAPVRPFSSSLPEEAPADDIRGEVVAFPLAQTGEGIAECELLAWHVSAGDQVEAFQPICEVQSDKATIEITSRYTGRILALHHKIGSMVATGAPLVDIELPPGDAPSHGSAPSSVEGSGNAATEVVPDAASPQPGHIPSKAGPVLTSPAVRAIAREYGLDLTTVAGSGPGGRITKGDVLEIIEGSPLPPAESAQPATTEKPDARQSAPGPKTKLPEPRTGVVADTAEPFQRISLRGYARAMVKTMTEANMVPHFYFCDEVCMDAMMTLRTRLNAEATDKRLTALPFILKAASLALEDYPAMNCQLSQCQTEVYQFKAHNLGVAIATQNGLVVPNVKDVQSKSITEISDELVQLQEMAAAGKLTPNHLRGGTLTVSNIGAIGGTYAMPLINSPEVAIVALGRARSVLKLAQDGSVVSSAMMNISWGADHRVVDGATVANFSNRWKQLLEDPQKMLLCLR